MLLDVSGIDNADNIYVYISLFKREVVYYLIGISERDDHNGNIRPLRYFERARVEGQHALLLAARALGINDDRAVVLVYILRRGLHRLERLTVIFPVQGQAAALVHDLADDGYLQIAGLGDKCNLLLGHLVDHDDGVCKRAVVRYHEIARILRDKLRSAYRNIRARIKHQKIRDCMQMPQPEFRRLFLRLILIYKQLRRQKHSDGVHKVRPEEIFDKAQQQLARNLQCAPRRARYERVQYASSGSDSGEYFKKHIQASPSKQNVRYHFILPRLLDFPTIIF